MIKELIPLLAAAISLISRMFHDSIFNIWHTQKSKCSQGNPPCRTHIQEQIAAAHQTTCRIYGSGKRSHTAHHKCSASNTQKRHNSRPDSRIDSFPHIIYSLLFHVDSEQQYRRLICKKIANAEISIRFIVILF